MSTNSAHLGLKLPEGGDSFLRTDFVTNWSKLDASPGIFPCTSTTRPVWGIAQKGMMIVETDTRRQLMWSGTAWQEPHTTAPTFYGQIDPEVTMTGSQTVNYTIGSFNLKRASRAVVWGTCIFRTRDNQLIEVSPWALIDGTSAITGGPGSEYYKEDRRFLTSDRDSYHQRALLGVRSLSAGNHTFGFHFGLNQNSTHYTSQAHLAQVRMVVMLANTSDT